jgi:putative hydrolase of the HAD superfamily
LELEEYLRIVGARLGIRPTQKHLERVLTIRTDAHRRLFVPRSDALATLTRLRALGLRAALVSNTSSEVPPLWHESPLAALVDVTVFSCTEGLMKPDRRIFQLAASRLGVEPIECFYVGDGADDELDGARAVGMDAILFTRATQAHRLAGRGLRSPRSPRCWPSSSWRLVDSHRSHLDSRGG